MTARTFDVAPGITGIDTEMAGRPMVTAAYLLDGDRPALIETGPGGCAARLVDALTELSVGPNDLAHVIVSHIHLDHAGGAGALARRFPRATVWAHERGAPHLADPSRLVASTIRTYGEDRVAELFGPTEPVPADRLRAVSDGTEIDLGGRTIRAIDAPGHASHELFLIDSSTGALFTGDGFGVYLPDVGILRPAAPPPEFDLDLAIASIRRAQAARPSTLVFSHFGPAPSVDETCDLAVERLRSWTVAVSRAVAADVGADGLADVLREETADETQEALDAGFDVGRYEFLSSFEMNAAGIARYVSKRADRS